MPTPQTSDLGNACAGLRPESNLLTAQPGLYHRPPQGRKHHNTRGWVSQDGGSRQIARRQKAPWVLVSNLSDRARRAEMVVKIYRQRM